MTCPREKGDWKGAMRGEGGGELGAGLAVGDGSVTRAKGRRVRSIVYNLEEGHIRQRLRESIALATFVTRDHNNSGDWNRSHMRGTRSGR